jgi:undecaprenyl-diphosphatase
MSGLDHSIMFFFNQFAQRWPMFDQIVVFFSNSDLMKGGVMITGIWWAWFYQTGDPRQQRSYLLTALAGSLVALLFARILAHALPLRVRPLLDPTLHFQRPAGVPDESNWTIWSSFPSDHAALFVALLTGIWFVSRPAAIGFTIYVIIGICFPRMYVGIHYPSDVLAGAALGVASVLACCWPPIRQLWTRPLLNWLDRWPAIGYALLFFITFQIASLFWDIRTFLFIFDISV